MIGYKSPPEILTLSQARLAQGSPLCERPCGKIVLQFMNIISHHAMQLIQRRKRS